MGNNRKPFEPIPEDVFYGHRLDDCKNGCPAECPAKLSAAVANAAIEQDRAEFERLQKDYRLEYQRANALRAGRDQALARVAELGAEVKRLKVVEELLRRGQRANDLGFFTKIDALRAQLAEAREVIKFYADPFTWARVGADCLAGVRLHDMYTDKARAWLAAQGGGE